MTEEIICKQRQIILEAIKKAYLSQWRCIPIAQLPERLTTKIAVEFLANGFALFGEGDNSYRIMVIDGTDVEAYLKKYNVT